MPGRLRCYLNMRQELSTQPPARCCSALTCHGRAGSRVRTRTRSADGRAGRKACAATRTLPEPMLAAPVSDPALLPGRAGEPKWDGLRAALSADGGPVVARSRRGTQMAPAFPDVVIGAAQQPDATALDSDLIVWDATGRLAFEQLQNRLHQRGLAALQPAAQQPAHVVAFDVLRLAGTSTLTWPYEPRRAALKPREEQQL